ncbi:hypothetical protein [Robertkochia aurantiaca]|uniref:hypothetical protein n=1 Tax=Robertkochia aurantiaca TaxID=2873700 RepID=UPI001CCE5D13|nr:hypothetical protein [Robertkochia sp. 3YJGBD-33]
MKKLFTAFMAIALAVSCTSDDDELQCKSCNFGGMDIELCDNGDGTMLVTIAGESESVDLQGQSFELVSEAFCSGEFEFTF